MVHAKIFYMLSFKHRCHGDNPTVVRFSLQMKGTIDDMYICQMQKGVE